MVNGAMTNAMTWLDNISPADMPEGEIVTRGVKQEMLLE